MKNAKELSKAELLHKQIVAEKSKGRVKLKYNKRAKDKKKEIRRAVREKFGQSIRKEGMRSDGRYEIKARINDKTVRLISPSKTETYKALSVLNKNDIDE